MAIERYREMLEGNVAFFKENVIEKREALNIHELKVGNEYILVTENGKSEPFTVVGIRFSVLGKYCIDAEYENDKYVSTY